MLSNPWRSLLATTYSRAQSVEHIRHSGSSLMEMVLLMTMIGFILMMSVKLMSRAVAVHQVAVTSVTDVRLSEAIEQRLRSDLSRCRAASINAATVVLVIDDQQSIHYEVLPPNQTELVRRVITSDKPEKLDSWQLPHRVQLTFKSETTPAGPTLVRIGVHSTSETPSMRQVSLDLVGSCDAE